MRASKFMTFVFLANLLNASCTNNGETQAPLSKAPFIDLSRLAGEWFVPMRIPTLLDRNAADMTVEIKPAAHQSLHLKWSFKSRPEDDRGASWNFKSTLAHPNDTTSWLVSPFWPLRFHYQVIEYSADYKWIVLGSDDRKNLWVLSREKNLPAELLNGLSDRLKSSKFDIATMVRQTNKNLN